MRSMAHLRDEGAASASQAPQLRVVQMMSLLDSVISIRS